VLIHVEVQTARDAEFPQRMYVYNYRVFDRYNRPVASLAVLARATSSSGSSWRCGTTRSPRSRAHSRRAPSANVAHQVGEAVDHQRGNVEMPQPLCAIAGRYRADLESVMKWVNGAADHVAERQSWSFDGHEWRDVSFVKPGHELPSDPPKKDEDSGHGRVFQEGEEKSNFRKSYGSVSGIDNFSTGKRENLDGLTGLQFIEGDITDPTALDKACPGAEIIFNEAARAAVPCGLPAWACPCSTRSTRCQFGPTNPVAAASPRLYRK